MMRSLLTAASGMMAQQTSVDTISYLILRNFLFRKKLNNIRAVERI